MTVTLDPDAIYQRLTRSHLGWRTPEPFGPTGYVYDTFGRGGRVIVTDSPLPGSEEVWRHASISWAHEMPKYAHLTMLHRAVWPNGWAYQVFAPPSDHINIHPYALHLWGRPDGSPVLPNFGALGTI